MGSESSTNQTSRRLATSGMGSPAIPLDAARQEMQRIRGEALGGSVMDPPV